MCRLELRQRRLRHRAEVLSWDSEHKVVERVQIVRSDEVEILLLADLLIGAVAYRNRSLSSNAGKTAVVARLERVANTRLDYSTPLGTEKVNLFQWQPRPPR